MGWEHRPLDARAIRFAAACAESRRNRKLALKPIKLIPSNAKYTAALGGLLIISAAFLAWYNAGGKYRIAYQSLIGEKLVEEEGKLLLWAQGERGTESAQWFDVTDSLINPKNFNYGIGKDSIASIDAPEFVRADDPRLADLRITMETQVIGYAFEGEARAYPVHIMNGHEVVNDTFGDTHLTVAW